MVLVESPVAYLYTLFVKAVKSFKKWCSYDGGRVSKFNQSDLLIFRGITLLMYYAITPGTSTIRYLWQQVKLL